MAKIKYNSFLIAPGVKVDILDRNSSNPYGGVAIEILKGFGRTEDEGQLIQIIPCCHDSAVDAEIALRIVSRAFAENIKRGAADGGC